MLSVRLVWKTPQAAELLAYIARVSSPENQVKDLPPRQLIKYLLGWRQGKVSFEPPHWSPFEQVFACLEVNTTRDIAHQILRHRSFAFQEFSQRYASIDKLERVPPREVRMQDPKNRQNSLSTDDEDLAHWWHKGQEIHAKSAHLLYQQALDKGVAKEVARAVLPEGLTATRLYMTGSFRSWIHYTEVRTGLDTQKEHRNVAIDALNFLVFEEPEIMMAVLEMRNQKADLISRAIKLRDE